MDEHQIRDCAGSYRPLVRRPRGVVHRADLDEGVVGSQYRSGIFCTSPEQRNLAEEMIRDVDASAHWPSKTVTKISEAVMFWETGLEDQDYFLRFRYGCKPPFPRQDDKSETASRLPSR
jgi:peptide-methionine (S)-S-oxide reductase